MTQFIAHDADGRIHFAVQAEMRPMPANGFIYQRWDAPLALTPETPSAVLHWRDDAPVWEIPLEEMRAEAIRRIDAAGEALRMAILSLPTQSEEYRRVEQQARAWAAAGYPEDEAPRGVSGWAQAKYRDGWTNRQACDDILATADVWLNVLDTIRDLRLLNKEDVRHAASAAAVRSITLDMRTDMLAIASQMQITLDLETA